MLGTAFPAARLLLVEQPHPWGFEGLRTSRFDAATALALEARGRAEGVRVQAIRRPGRSPDGAQRRWAIVDTRADGAGAALGRVHRRRRAARAPAGRFARRAGPGSALPRVHPRQARSLLRGARAPAGRSAGGRPPRARLAGQPPGRLPVRAQRARPAARAHVRAGPAVRRRRARRRRRGGRGDGGAAARTHRPPAGRAGRARLRTRAAGAAALPGRLAGVDDAGRRRHRARADQQPAAAPSTSPCDRERVDAAGLTCAAPGPSWFVAHRPVAIEPVGDV